MTFDSSHTVRQRVLAFAFGLSGVATFSVMDAMMKHLTSQTHAAMVTEGRYLFALPFALLIWWRAGRPTVTREMWRAHAVRAAVISVAGYLFIWSLSVLPLADAITLSFVAPLLVPFVARVLLKEKLRAQNVAASVAGFAGAMIAVSGGEASAAASGHDPQLYRLGVAAAVTFSLGYAVQVSLLRARAQLDGSAIVGVMGTMLPALLVMGPALAVAPLPSFDALPWFLGVGAIGAVSLWLFTEAYARAEAQVLAPIDFTALGWSALFGYAFFHENPRPQLWIGAAIIVTACLWSGWAATRGKVEGPEAP